jgi:hypothetical protein
MARAKREFKQEDQNSPIQDQSPEKRTLLILSTTQIWSRIITNQFKKWGFQQSKVFSEFKDLMEYIINGLEGKTLKDFAVAIGTRDISRFIIAWENSKHAHSDEKAKITVKKLIFFFPVDSNENVNPLLEEYFGRERILNLKEDSKMNYAKIQTAMGKYQKRETVDG